MTRGDLRDRLDGCELDLSMDSLSVVPVKELAALTRATHVDLSCNMLNGLPDLFCTLTHLVKLDLSKNKLTSLPAEFGCLNKLQYIDLFENQIATLPVTIFKLKSLKYLDLKSNPLNETLARVAGDCMHDAQCKECAKRIVAFMKEVNSEQERRRQKELQKMREEEVERQAEAEVERQRIKVGKLERKERRRQEYEEEQQRIRAEKRATLEAEGSNGDAVPVNGMKKDPLIERKSNTGFSTCTKLFTVLIVFIAVFLGLAYYCDINQKIPQCHQAIQLFKQARRQIHQYYESFNKAEHK